jgi:dTDP-glucose pyrophosphorylase
MAVPNVIITMAGEGRRFRDAGYDVPKFAIVALGRPLFAWSMESLRSFIDAGARFFFVVRRADVAQSFIAAEAARLGIAAFDLLELDTMTDGQATSALLAGALLGDDAAPIIVYNIDTYVDPHALRLSAVRGDGWVPCFPGLGDAWSFVRLDEDDGKAVEVREKQRVSPHATVGLYYFSSFALYRDSYRRYYADAANLERGERYIAPMYNQLIADRRDVYIERVPLQAVHPLGTPAELERFSAHPPAGGVYAQSYDPNA